jgi:hypothetical protein
MYDLDVSSSLATLYFAITPLEASPAFIELTYTSVSPVLSLSLSASFLLLLYICEL